MGIHTPSTPLIYASRNGHINIAQLLLNNGADVNVKDSWGRTAMMVAKSKGHTEIVELLQQAGATK